MQVRDGTLRLAASDINDFVECEHLTQLERSRARGEIAWVAPPDPGRDLLAEKGRRHEADYLQRLRDAGRSVVEIAHGPDEVARTQQALRVGRDVVYQAAFERDNWRGYADFLFRVPGPSALGDYHYEVGDTKLASRPKPYFLLQLCYYSEHLAALQGAEPVFVHLILGNGTHERYRVRDFAAYYRAVRNRFVDVIERSPVETYPLPCAHCSICEWAERCHTQRVDDDHLSLVAGIRRSQIHRLEDAGIKTMSQLANDQVETPGIRQTTAEGLRLQAELQTYRRETGLHRYQLLPPQGPHRGLSLLPPPSEGDVFFDMEGDPWFEGGIEYLFGCTTTDTAFRGFWAHTRLEEKRAFESFVDFVTERRRRYPDMHVYHYAFYEPAALKRLMGRHATREEEVDTLLRDGVLVDLYTVVRQSIRASVDGYGLKKMEAFYMDPREGEITDAGTSVVEYERYLETGDEGILESIRVYNEMDCRSTMMLCSWLRERAQEADGAFPPYEPAAVAERERSERSLAADAERTRVTEALLDGIPEVREDRSARQQAQWLLAQLLDWHRREDKPEWWAFFARLGASPEELVDDAECIGDVQLDDRVEPEIDKRSTIFTLRFPPQETKLSAGARVFDPATLKGAGELLSVDAAAGILRLRRATQDPLPRSLIPGGPYDNRAQRAAMLRLGKAVHSDGIAGSGRYGALRDLLLRALPRVRGRIPGQPLVDPGDGDTLGAAIDIARNLDESTLFIQGPPGSGKTYTAARIIVALMRDGKRIGVASNSHKAINNLLAEVEHAARELQFTFRGAKKISDAGSVFEGEFIENVEDAGKIVHDLAELSLVGGTAWLFAREEFDGAFDVLFVDEAGQVSLANALAMGTAARNLVLVGDPMQLAQPTKGHHPDGAGVSVLEHLLGDDETVSDARGIFLAHSWRMHPDVCTFISDVMYEGRLRAHPGNERRHIQGAGAGLRTITVRHEGNVQSSSEEAAVIASTIRELLGKTYTRKDGTSRPLELGDFLVVTPYNAQVNCLRAALPDGARIGTVDRFQGQEAPIVLFSTATSSGEELPRTLEFLFSRNRLNVAISRAKCVAILVTSPKLLDVRCRTVEQMRMVNAMCRFVELARAAG